MNFWHKCIFSPKKFNSFYSRVFVIKILFDNLWVTNKFLISKLIISIVTFKQKNQFLKILNLAENILMSRFLVGFGNWIALSEKSWATPINNKLFVMNSANGKATTIINQTNFSQIMVIYKNTFFLCFLPVELDVGVCKKIHTIIKIDWDNLVNHKFTFVSTKILLQGQPDTERRITLFWNERFMLNLMLYV